ncbi:MAG: hypothetical protein KBD24_01940, partial [Candidatus Pacebacteria bacterium]|nr:hypothetical protein [Candidatus Paceibacterota bacterium]
AVGENLALGDFTSNKGVVDAWMKSPGHRANILASKFTEIGIATGKGMHKGRNVWLVVQAFGLPRSVCPPVDSALKKKIDSLAQMLEILEMVARMREKSIQKDTNISPTLYREKIDSYNKVVGLYNSRVEESKRLVATYNKSVDRLNACIKQKTSS